MPRARASSNIWSRRDTAPWLGDVLARAIALVPEGYRRGDGGFDGDDPDPTVCPYHGKDGKPWALAYYWPEETCKVAHIDGGCHHPSHQTQNYPGRGGKLEKHLDELYQHGGNVRLPGCCAAKDKLQTHSGD